MWVHCRQSLIDGQLHVCALQYPAGGGASTRSEWNTSEWQLHRSGAMHVGRSERLSREQHQQDCELEYGYKVGTRARYDE